MRFLDAIRDHGVETLQVYLSETAARRLRSALDALLKAPEDWTHEHVFAEDGSREMSLSIVTPRKLGDLARYSEIERRVLTED